MSFCVSCRQSLSPVRRMVKIRTGTSEPPSGGMLHSILPSSLVERLQQSATRHLHPKGIFQREGTHLWCHVAKTESSTKFLQLPSLAQVA
jgi:hypothetical protein